MKTLIPFIYLLNSTLVIHGQAGPPKPCTPAVVNGGFEQPVSPTCWSANNANGVPGWNTTASDNMIELWDASCMGVPAYAGAQFAELNANMVSNLYEEICTPCPNLVSWSFAHRGRIGIDVCALKAGPPGGPYTILTTASDGPSGWGFYSGTYNVPPGQTVTRFLFESVSTANAQPMMGNFIDAVNFSFSGLNISTSQTNISCGTNTGTASVTVNSGSGPFTYNWIPSGGNNATATGLGAGTYTVIVSNAGGCSAQAVVNITSTSGFTATGSQTNASCFGMSNGIASVIPGGGTAPYSYVWTTSPVQTSPSVSNLPAGSYSCVITDANGCSAVQSITITQPPPMNISITTLPASCILTDGSASVTVAGGASPYTYAWTTNPVQTSSFVNNLGPGNYSLLVTDAMGCTQIQNTTITGGISPLANFTFDPETLLIGNTSVNFTDLSNNAYTWSWNFGDGNSAYQQNPVHAYSDTGTYCITLAVSDPTSQCFDTITKCLKVVDAQFAFYIPNSFTPNGDFMNEVFFGKGRGIKEYNIWLFDRWGNQIWDCHYEEKNASWDSNSQTDLPSFCKWDGKVANGGLDMNGNSKQLAQEDVYVWKVSLTDVFDKNHRYVGHVSIVR